MRLLTRSSFRLGRIIASDRANRCRLHGRSGGRFERFVALTSTGRSVIFNPLSDGLWSPGNYGSIGKRSQPCRSPSVDRRAYSDSLCS